jgi:hypothetical protein
MYSQPIWGTVFGLFPFGDPPDRITIGGHRRDRPLQHLRADPRLSSGARRGRSLTP